ncbi:hypothetical protein [Paractinoplanes toevensis]|uniref:Uncharacterized protein n=1 Tax=Paractinoplanes toevensis TaxID=571911 RepID=A0A919WBQ1_9ACTN|nr:hypothetical protein [Actinoplanes toevensis]GIM97148.1 hypothetical protein Ato02nite_089410 [Actinoplanes toevensis]
MTTIETLREKIDTLRAVEAERRFGNIIDPGTALEPIGGLPDGTTELFSLFTRLAGSYFYFKTPPQIRTPDAWQEHEPDESPLGDSLEIGYEILSVGGILPDDGPHDDERVGAPIRMSTDDGHVYYLDPEDYIFLYKNPDAGGVDVETFAPDPITFFDQFVLGEQYTRLVEVVLSADAVNRRHRKTGEYSDSWRRLLIAAGLSE